MKTAMKVVGLCLCVTLLPGAALGVTLWDQGFETDTSGWLDSDDSWYGDVSRVASGTGGIASSEGSWHAIFTQSGPSGDETGPFSRFDGYHDTWPGGWTACIDVYLDTSWAAGAGFDYSVSTNNSSGSFLRDFIFHITKDTSTGSLLVGGSNNTNFDPREDLENINHYTVVDSGWYTLQHVFRDQGGFLVVDLNLLDSGGSLLWTETRDGNGDAISNVGGNRYAWFTNIDIAGGVAVDNHCREEVPEPATMALIGTGLAALAARRKRLV
ncbi:MAG: PEP-CTERM sorting domain-containing protein [Candidatus Omnitrophica bacterium]|nr:PEP-CTERM sorting domain-containing protein [Candidatus Omnitrophota bacterium]